MDILAKKDISLLLIGTSSTEQFFLNVLSVHVISLLLFCNFFSNLLFPYLVLKIVEDF